jgi:hypothetical protein
MPKAGLIVGSGRPKRADEPVRCMVEVVSARRGPAADGAQPAGTVAIFRIAAERPWHSNKARDDSTPVTILPTEGYVFRSTRS